MSEEIERMLAAAKAAAPDVDDTTVRAIVHGVLNALDDLIEEDDPDHIWPDVGDLGLLATELKTA